MPQNGSGISTQTVYFTLVFGDSSRVSRRRTCSSHECAHQSVETLSWHRLHYRRPNRAAYGAPRAAKGSPRVLERA